MSEHRKILVSMPDSLLREIDQMVAMGERNRSEFIREAMKLYIRERQKIEIREKMRKGYEEMARINAELTEVGANCDIEALMRCEAVLTGRK